MDSRYWSPEYELGIDEIDQHHRALVQAIEQVEKSISGKDRWIVVHNTLVELANWAKFHFAVEESLMRIFEYPGIEGHIVAHQSLTETIRRFQTSSLRNDIAAEIAGFLKSWLESHIRTADRDYAEYIRDRLALR